MRCQKQPIQDRLPCFKTTGEFVGSLFFHAFLSHTIIGIICIGMIIQPVLSHASEKTYFDRAKSDDYLSIVFYRLGLRPLYGREGSLRNSLDLKPSKKESQGDLLLPGEKIILPVSDRTKLSHYALILSA